MKPKSWWVILMALPLLLAAFWLVTSRPGSHARNEADPSPVAAVHTLRADDQMLRLASEAGFDAVVQVFSWNPLARSGTERFPISSCGQPSTTIST